MILVGMTFHWRRHGPVDCEGPGTHIERFSYAQYHVLEPNLEEQHQDDLNLNLFIFLTSRFDSWPWAVLSAGYVRTLVSSDRCAKSPGCRAQTVGLERKTEPGIWMSVLHHPRNA